MLVWAKYNKRKYFTTIKSLML